MIVSWHRLNNKGKLLFVLVFVNLSVSIFFGLNDSILFFFSFLMAMYCSLCTFLERYQK
jgi:hypothetical protein